MITVVIASYQYGHLAAHAIESVLCQTKPVDEIMFVDDGAGDCKHLENIYPEIDFYFRDKNLGVVDNFQDMLFRVTTEKCLFLGADNWLRPDTIELLSQQTSDIVTYDIMVTGTLRDNIAKSYPTRPRQGDLYWDRAGSWHGSMLYNTTLAKKVGGYAKGTSAYNTEEDMVLWQRMLKAGATVSHVPQGLLYYRRHRENFFKYKT
jgi:glycosyltransferase involved in cell wall biosynthesis